MSDKDFTLEDAVHVMHGDSAAGSLKQCGCRDMIILVDPIFPGPSDIDPVRHHQKRKAELLSYAKCYEGPDYMEYWSQFAEMILSAGEFINQLKKAGDRPIVFWTSANFSDRLVFWWILHSVHGCRLDIENWWVVEPPLRQVDLEDGYPAPSVGQSLPKNHADSFADRRKLNRRLILAGAAMWRKYAGTSPREFDLACRKNPASFPGIGRESRIYLRYFPQIGKSRRSELRLSDFDQALLDGLHTEQWLRPIDLLKSNHDLINFMVGGDFVVTGRLRRWAGLKNPAILMRKEKKGHNDWTLISCKLTSHGKSLRDYGLESAIEAPVMHLGGCCAYGENPTWVRRWRGKHSSIDAVR